MNLPSVAILIPTARQPEKLKRCLRQLIPYVSEHSDCMIVVSDDGDASETTASLGTEFDSVRVIQGPRRGPAANRNYGAAQSKGDLLIFLDDDCTPEPGLIEVYRQAAQMHPECDVFEGRITAVGERTGFADACPENETGGYFWSCNVGMRREFFTAIGGFDERFPFPAMEDIELSVRIKGKTKTLFLPRARVFHAVERRAGWKRFKHGELSKLLYMHVHGLRQTQMGPISCAKQFVRTVLFGSVRCLRAKAGQRPTTPAFDHSGVRRSASDYALLEISCSHRENVFPAMLRRLQVCSRNPEATGVSSMIGRLRSRGTVGIPGDFLLAGKTSGRTSILTSQATFTEETLWQKLH